MNSQNPAEKSRKESDVGVHCTTEYTPRQASAFDKFMHNMNKKPVITQSERYHTEGYNNVITEAEVIYESLNSSRRQSPEKGIYLKEEEDFNFSHSHYIIIS